MEIDYLKLPETRKIQLVNSIMCVKWYAFYIVFKFLRQSIVAYFYDFVYQSYDNVLIYSFWSDLFCLFYKIQ